MHLVLLGMFARTLCGSTSPASFTVMQSSSCCFTLQQLNT
jgi:hypothetical protein